MGIVRDFATVSLLIIEDEEHARSIYRAFLQPERFRLFFAGNGKEGIQHLESCDGIQLPLPDVIISDIMMPEMDGIAVCRSLKAHPVWCHIPVLVASVLSDNNNIAMALDAGADDYVTKPLGHIELRARIRSMIRQRRQYVLLEQSNVIKDNILHMVAHDFVRPLDQMGSELNRLESNMTNRDELDSLRDIMGRMQLSMDDLRAVLSADN